MNGTTALRALLALCHEVLVGGGIVRKQIRELTIVNENKITRKNREIVNKYSEKVFKFNYNKRVIRKVNESHIDTLPYGY